MRTKESFTTRQTPAVKAAFFALFSGDYLHMRTRKSPVDEDE
jgi:hypothetical protein